MEEKEKTQSEAIEYEIPFSKIRWALPPRVVYNEWSRNDI